MDLLKLYTLHLTEIELRVLRRIAEVAKEQGEVNQFYVRDMSDGPGIEYGNQIRPLFEDRDFNLQADRVLTTLDRHELIILSQNPNDPLDRRQLDITEDARTRLSFEELSPGQQKRRIRGLQLKSRTKELQATIAFFLSILLLILQILEYLGIKIRFGR